jgi:preprotein translocase subunit SecG
MGLIIAIHLIVCALLIGIILIQAGRGGGLVEGFSGVESMFGTKTNAFLTRTTTILAVVFFITCVSLALLSARQSRSLMQNIKDTTEEKTTPAQETQTAQQQKQPQQQQQSVNPQPIKTTEQASQLPSEAQTP